MSKQPANSQGYSIPPTYPQAQWSVPSGPLGAQPTNPNVQATGQFDPGARFTNTSGTVNIPPPPPGYAPNAAQQAATMGGTVNMQQPKTGFFSGQSDGGVYTGFK